jgi:hypothetical protein
MGLVKRFSREAGKPFIPPRNASIVCFLAALTSIVRDVDDAPPL